MKAGNVTVQHLHLPQLSSCFATAPGCRSGGDDLSCPDTSFSRSPASQPAVTAINHEGCHLTSSILPFSCTSALRQYSRWLLSLDAKFLPPNELHVEALSPFILPLISPANACVSQSRSWPDLNLLYLKRFLEKSVLHCIINIKLTVCIIICIMSFQVFGQETVGKHICQHGALGNPE